MPQGALTTPLGFARLFPASAGAIYGRSPQSLLAPMLRPTAQTRLPGLYLAGGGAHPGAGVPMAALSGLHAAEAILNGPVSMFSPRPAAMRGGISMG
jgi:1-hydroxycarotenoid 3,4-desaturase